MSGHAHHSAPVQDMPAHDMPDMDMGMKMYFHTGMTDKNMLIYGWDVTDGARLTGTLIAVFLIGVFYECIKYVRVVHHKSTQPSIMSQHSDTPQSWVTQVTVLPLVCRPSNLVF